MADDFVYGRREHLSLLDLLYRIVTFQEDTLMAAIDDANAALAQVQNDVQSVLSFISTLQTGTTGGATEEQVAAIASGLQGVASQLEGVLPAAPPAG